MTLKIAKYDTAVGVGLDMLAEYDRKPEQAKFGWRYTPGQAWHVLVCQRRSIASRSCSVPSYLWCETLLDEGEVSLGIDYGSLPYAAYCHGENPRHASYINLPAHEGAETGSWYLMPDLQHSYGSPSEEEVQRYLFETGLPLGAPFILKTTVSYHSSYDYWSGATETDCEIDSEIVWVDSNHLREHVWLPVRTPW